MRAARPPSFRVDAARARPDALGAEFDGEGTNFALFSAHATRVELCLFDAAGRAETQRLDMPLSEGGIWHAYLPGATPGLVYGYRVHGPQAPREGHRFNPAKLLLDPYARELRGDLVWDDALFGYAVGQDDLSFDPRDSAPFMPKAVVVDPDFDWQADSAIRRPWTETVIYEAHVKGLTMRHPDVPEADRGTFAGLASDAVIEHLLRVGATAIELLPVHGFLHDRHLIDKGLSNYWGYNTLGFFAPHGAYLRSGDIREVKRAIRRFHEAGIEVILDVVYNHTAEGSELGPTLSFRGIDNASYYLLSPEDPRHCFDVTGTGNTLNVAHPMVLRMVLDSLRYWVQAMHVDGFRFDLASTLGREATGFEREGTFFSAIRQDPVLSRVKLIAEPWDVGHGGYQVGAFPWPFREWNDKFRDDVRAFWRRDPGQLPALAQRLAGSPVQFDHSHRPATSSINFLAAHDGFTLWDTVSFNEKHNGANGEDGADGHNHNVSDNMGVEGPTDDPVVTGARERRVRAMLATLFLSQGVPMLLAGDEFGQSQGGNNNAYCQDNETAWLDWGAAREGLVETVAAMTRLRAALALASPGFVAGPGAAGERTPAVTWIGAEGKSLDEAGWADGDRDCLGMLLSGGALEAPVLICLNGGDDTRFRLPAGTWRLRLDTAGQDMDGAAGVADLEGEVALGWQSVCVLERRD